jgi:phage terminase large subunit GpA-like protein
VPDEAVVITAGCDVQADRIEIEFVAWGKGEQSWSLEYHSLPGNPGDVEMWTRLDALLTRRRPHRKLGSLLVAATCIDAGNWAKSVYTFTGRRFHRKVFAIKGSSDPYVAIWPRRPSRPKAGREAALFIVGTAAAKDTIVSRLRIEQRGRGYCNFPSDRDLDYYEQLTSERPIRKIVRGEVKRVWVKTGAARNEALDCRFYSLCALHALRSYGYDLDREAARVAAMPCVDPAQPKPSSLTMAERYRRLAQDAEDGV